VQRKRCDLWAAVLIGPYDASAALLRHGYDITHAVQRWGMATPKAPTVWKNKRTPADQDRLLDALYHAPDDAAICLPWLPEAGAANIVDRSDRAYLSLAIDGDRIDHAYLSLAIDAYVAASPIARAGHDAVPAKLIQCAKRDHIAALTRLAAAFYMDAAWTEVAQLLRESPNDVERVVAAASWAELHANVQTTMLSAANRNSICAVIAFARGVRERPPPVIMQTLAAAFFAAVTLEVWKALPEEKQCMWRCALDAWMRLPPYGRRNPTRRSWHTPN
jgi:hypothetical protein